MNLSSVIAHHLKADDVRLGRVLKTGGYQPSMVQRSLAIGNITFITAALDGAEQMRKDAAGFTALANAAAELAHWCEDIAGDLESATCGACGPVRSSNRCPDCVRADVREDRAIEAQS